jgi:hypothetical protein
MPAATRSAKGPASAARRVTAAGTDATCAAAEAARAAAAETAMPTTAKATATAAPRSTRRGREGARQEQCDGDQAE